MPVADIVREVGTPATSTARRCVRSAHGALDRAFEGYPHTLHFALKANSTLAILRLLRGLGASADANSGGEIEAALRAGFEPAQIVFTGVGKTRDELDRAVGLGVKAINIESDGEAERIDALARARGVKARVALRVNPDIDPNTHAHISTGLRANKFGVPIEFAAALLRDLARKPGLEPVGLHVHLGSQIVDVEPLGRAARALAGLARRGARCRRAASSTSTSVAAWASPTTARPQPTRRRTRRRSLPAIRETGLHLLIEPGPVPRRAGRHPRRSRGRHEGVPGVAAVHHPRHRDDRAHPADAVRGVPPDRGGRRRAKGRPARARSSGRSAKRATRWATTARLGPVEVDDLIAVLDAGAYGFVMASNYNRRRMPAEVLVDGGAWTVIRQRQTFDDLFRNERWNRVAGLGAVRGPPASPKASLRGCLTFTGTDCDMTGMLIAFEGLDQSGKETQARLLRQWFEARGRQVESLGVSRLRDADRRGDLEGPARRARLRPRHDPAPAHRQPFRVEAEDPGVARRRPRRHLRSVPGVERRVRRGAGPRPALADGDAGVPAAA